MSKPLVISFYTNDWKYPQHAQRMAKDCQNLGLEYHIEQKESTRDYIRNTAIKPLFVQECLHRFQRPVLWVDVDGILLKDPGLTNISADFAACEYLNKQNLDRDWAVSMLWFNYSPGSLKLVDEWCAFVGHGTDEAAFDIAWKRLKNHVTVHQLPEHYLFSKWSVTLKIPEGTIFCNQLSTFEDKMRRKINGQVKG